MNRFLAACVVLWLSSFSAPSEPYFSGCIVYENEYQTLAGDRLYYAVNPKNWFYVQDNNFKLYDRNKKLLELYIGDKNEFYTVENGKAVLMRDTARRPPSSVLKCLPTTATILGHPCQMLQLIKGSTSALIFYSPEVRIDATLISHFPAPGWFSFLQATDGALPLRVIMVDAQHDVTMTTEAISVQNMPLAAADFTTTAPAR
jgi:hypothetical protein